MLLQQIAYPIISPFDTYAVVQQVCGSGAATAPAATSANKQAGRTTPSIDVLGMNKCGGQAPTWLLS